MANEAPDAWWQTPRSWLYAWDLARDCGRFLSLNRETLWRSSFLDQRIETDTTKFKEVPITELLAQPITTMTSAPPNFIFHTSFCCSTLLARSLDIPGRTLVLREPATFLQLADLTRGFIISPRSSAELLPQTLSLVAPPFDPAERAITKLPNLANNLARELLAVNPGSRALLLYDDLEPFLLAVLKHPRARAHYITEFLRRLLNDPAGRAWLTGHAVPESLAARATLVWMLQVRALQTWCANEGRDRIRMLHVEELIDDPAGTLAASASWLGLNLSSAEAVAIVRGPLWKHRAKDPALPFDIDKRRKEQRLARRLLAGPIREGLTWAEKNHETAHANFPDILKLLA